MSSMYNRSDTEMLISLKVTSGLGFECFPCVNVIAIVSQKCEEHDER